MRRWRVTKCTTVGMMDHNQRLSTEGIFGHVKFMWLYEAPCFHHCVNIHVYFKWLDILILYKETHVQILVWGDMKADNLCNI